MFLRRVRATVRATLLVPHTVVSSVEKVTCQRSGTTAATSTSTRTEGRLLFWNRSNDFDGEVRPPVGASPLVPEPVICSVPKTFFSQKKTSSQVKEPKYDHRYEHYRSYQRPLFLLITEELCVGTRYEHRYEQPRS